MRPAPPILELASLATGGGKTHLLYCLTALAVLPIYLNGKQACVVIIDTDASFSVPRLAEQLTLMMKKQQRTEASESDIPDTVTSALKHVHIFRPQSLDSTFATLDALPNYLFDKSRHHSIDRPVGFLAVDSASAFYWQHRADEDDASLLQNTDPGQPTPSQPTGYTRLATALKAASASFSCPVILTSWHLGAAPASLHSHTAEARSLRPSLPAPLSQLPTLRLIVQRVSVRKFPAGISIEEARREAADRQTAVEEGKCEAIVNEWGVDERTLQKLQSVGAGFGFRIRDEGLTFDGEDV
ncbi:hypothetical protein LTR36_010464 [Oleoguttula mirabilis]|uniref:DNA recombination and repair protein Rad51-like C-terminal domain-containing protein n=1 Tax=Oleoguttula mirabilis TaxID=1507867 RepID=A0AAV9J4W0_9PEZI|nr:hypothetical protein LTR36_010464 [Oleoguttula mirabilis]